MSQPGRSFLANVTPPGWHRMIPERRGRLISLLLSRGLETLASGGRLYARVETSAHALALRQEVEALAEFGDATCPGGCGADLAVRGCSCDDKETFLQAIKRIGYRQ